MPINTRSSTRKQRAVTPTVNSAAPEPSDIEPLTPTWTEQEADAATLAASRLHLPLLLIRLLDASNEDVHLEDFKEFLSTLPVSDLFKLRSLFEKIYQCCDGLCASDPNEADYISESSREALKFKRTGSDKAKAGSEAQALFQPHEEDSGDDPETSIGVQVGSTASNSLVGPLVQYRGPSNASTTGLRSPIKGLEVKEAGPNRISRGLLQPVLSAFDKSESNTDETAVIGGAVRSPNSPDEPLRTILPTPKGTPAKERGPTCGENGSGRHSSQLSWQMVTQSNAEFARESINQVDNFKLPRSSLQTYKTIFTSLKPEKCGKVKWSDGSEWMVLVEAALHDRRRSSIQYALTAMAFSRWYSSQKELSTLPPRAAASEVSGRLLGLAPEDESAKTAWERRRKNLTTHLTRGRKWTKLVEQLGFGILFKSAWTLAKADDHSLTELITLLQESSVKMLILRLLGEQMGILLETGQTRPVTLQRALEEQGILDMPSPPSASITSTEVVELQESMRKASKTGQFQVQGIPFQFHVDTLDDLREESWFHDELILLCLHLADQLPNVRVGFSVPIHQNMRGRQQRPLRDPFERAVSQIEEWNKAEIKNHLICFFPLLQHDNHFSLLEINQQDNFIYHYDSKGYDTCDIQAACKKQFPRLHYKDQRTPRQLDAFSCGPLVVAMARRRMLSQEVVCDDINGTSAVQIRADALSLIRRAWYSNIIRPAQPLNKKRKCVTGNEALAKRHKPVIVIDD
ncbi:hypothetical protein F5Y13DRAFT_204285 [Hypoxylon sp. FL1857]|nr:hypothetical protein F5Y13DRAFT_204285 [Hypoxylon sp. FL1857]